MSTQKKVGTTDMPITEARVNLGAVVRRVAAGERITLEKGGIPVATLVSPQWIEDMEDALELALLREKHAREKGSPLNAVLKRHEL